MKELIAILFITSYVFANFHVFTNQNEARSEVKSCKLPENLVAEYRVAHYNYVLRLHKFVATRYNFNFVFSARSVGLMLAAMAEAADDETRQQIFQFLHMPEDWCLRREYYMLAAESISFEDDVDVNIRNALVLDERLKINSQWTDLVSYFSLLEVINLPIKNSAAESIKAMVVMTSGNLLGLNLTGNSVLLNAFDFSGIWTSAFNDANVELTPFYNMDRVQVGYIDLVLMKRRANITYVPEFKAKVLELPLGIDNRYLFMMTLFDTLDLATPLSKMTVKMMFGMRAGLKGNERLVDVALPRLSMTSQVDVRKILEEDIGIKTLWNDEAATRVISEPAALPSGFVHRTTVTFDTRRVDPSRRSDAPCATSQAEDTFIANQLFIFSIFDEATGTVILSAACTQPTYPN